MKLDHIAMYVNDLETTKQFFKKYFNATSSKIYHNQTTNFKSYFLSFEDETRLEIMNDPTVTERNQSLKLAGYIHMAFNLGSKEAVDSLTMKLLQDGYEVISGPRITGDGYYESCVLGIEGNQIELTI